MLTTTHALLGASVGYAVKNPFSAFMAGVVLHFLADKIPHYWPDRKKYQIITMAIDSVCSLTVVIYLFLVDPFTNTEMAWGALGGIAVDFLLVGIPYLYHTKIGQWHTQRQPHRTAAIYLVPDFFASLLLVGLLVKLYLK